MFRTCRELGIGTVAVFSDPDAAEPHAREADAAVRLAGAAPGDTYLRAELIVDAARRAGADAVHPGYGFLSENADFARAVSDAGLTWIGPSPDAIAAMGSKIEAKRLMAAAGVPVLTELDPATITEADLPVLIKASAGGGGRGMRVVTDLAALPGEVELARAEAASAFGDGTVFCEPYLATGRHIEVQVLADEHGTVWAVGERECSVQRRHQKVVEEAPSPLVERIDGMRAALFDAARAAAKAIDYTGAGTVEFLSDHARAFLLPRDEHAPAGRAPCHRVHDRTRSRGVAARHRARRPAGRESPVHTRTFDRGASLRREPGSGWQPQSGPVHRLDVPGVTTEFAVGAGATASVSMPASAPGRPCRCTTTRCSPRSSHGHRPASRPHARLPARSRAPASTA